MTDWTRRLVVTLGVVAGVHVLQFVPFPGLGADLRGPSVLGGWLMVSRTSSGFAVAALGIVPLQTAAGFVTLVFALVPKFRQSLDSADGEDRLLRTIWWGTVPFALVQSTAVGLFLHEVSLEHFVVPNPWFAGGTTGLFGVMCGALPFALQRWGLTRGLASIVLLYCLLALTRALHSLVFNWVVGATSVQVFDLGLIAMLVVTTVIAMNKWLGDSPLMTGDPRLDRIGLGLCVAMISLVALNTIGLQWLMRWSSISEFGGQLLSLVVAVGGGLVLAKHSGEAAGQPIAGARLLALGTFVLLSAFATVVLSRGRVPMPWAECVVATILLYTTWRNHQREVPARFQFGDRA